MFAVLDGDLPIGRDDHLECLFWFRGILLLCLLAQWGGQVSFGPADRPGFQIPCSLERGAQNLGFGIVCSGIFHRSDSNQHQVEPVLAWPCHDRVHDRLPRIISGPAPGHLPDRNHAALGVASDMQAACQGLRSSAIGDLPLKRPGSTGFIEPFEKGNHIGGDPLGSWLKPRSCQVVAVFAGGDSATTCREVDRPVAVNMDRAAIAGVIRCDFGFMVGAKANRHL